MNILYFHQYFKTPSEPGGTRSYWIAQELLKAGHNVTMITSSVKYDEKIKRITIDGIEVIYIKEAYSQNMTIYKRLKAFVGFMLKSTNQALKLKETDLVIATSTPLTIGFPALILKWFKKIPYVFEVRDLWPEVPIQMGALKNPVVRNIALTFEKTIYKNSKHVIALSPGMQDGVLKYLPKQKTSMIPNMSKIDAFWPRQKNESMIEQLGLSSDSFKVIHFGALGIANGASYIIEAANLLKENSSIEFLFVGGGSTENDLKKMCREYKLKNVRFLGRFAMNELSEIVNLSDVSIVSFKDLPILYTNSPNKLFDSLSAGKPIIVNSAGWTKRLVEENSCGYYVNPNHPSELVEKILYMQKHPSIVKQLGVASRKLAETKYDKSLLCKQVVDIVNKLEIE